MRKMRLAAALLALCFLLTACGDQTPPVDDTPSSDTQQTQQEPDKDTD